MISIKVGGTPLYIPKDTALVLEQNNNLFAAGGFTDDVVWTFELPAEPNQVILGPVQFHYSGGRKRYDCELALDGAPFSRGVLYIQSATDARRLECGVVASSFGIGFGDRKLSENEYAPDITISESEDMHQQNWVEFLRKSLDANSIYKFFLFACEDFCKGNEDFGYHNGILSGLRNMEDDDYFSHYVNRLFFDTNGNIYNNAEKDIDGNVIRQGVRLFNTASKSKQNGYTFAPALRLVWLVRQVLTSAGLNAWGSFFTDAHIKQLFSQSMCGMDDSVFQYGVHTYLRVNGDINRYDESIDQSQAFDTDSGQAKSFGWIGGVSIGFRLLLPVEELVRNNSDADVPTGDDRTYHYRGQSYDEVYAIAISTATASLPTIRMRASLNEADGTPAFHYGRMPTADELRQRAERDSDYTVTSFRNFSGGGCMVRFSNDFLGIGYSHSDFIQFYTPTDSMLVQLTASKSKDVFFRNAATGGYVEGNVRQIWSLNTSATTPLFLRLVKCRIYTSKGDTSVRLLRSSYMNNAALGQYGDLEYIDQYEIQDTLELSTTDVPLNIYSNVLRWRDHVPNLTNGEFLGLVCKIFGLNMYANALTKEVQLSFFTDTLKGNVFDIGQWVTGIERMEYAPKMYHVTLSPVLGTKDVAERNIIPSVPTSEDLPGALIHKNKHCFVQNEKAYRRSTQEKETSNFSWEQSGGDDRTLTAGPTMAEETEEENIDAGIPNMRHIDMKSQDKYLCEVATSGCSPMFDEDFSGEFDFVLQQYKGKRLIQMSGGTVSSAYIEDANPTALTATGSSDNYLELAATGRNSIGEQWLRPLYQFKGSNEQFRLTAIMPSWAFLKVFATLKPQSGTPDEQVRWLYCRGRRFLPTKISAELGSRDNVVCAIECAATHVDV